MNHEWQLRRKFATDTMMRCTACKALRVEYMDGKGGRLFNYRRKGHYNWHAEEPVCGPKSATEPKPVAAPTASKNVSRDAVVEVAAELRKKADEAYDDCLAARKASEEYRREFRSEIAFRARHAAYATAAEMIERGLK